MLSHSACQLDFLPSLSALQAEEVEPLDQGSMTIIPAVATSSSQASALDSFLERIMSGKNEGPHGKGSTS